jgi:hypothetical protein
VRERERRDATATDRPTSSAVGKETRCWPVSSAEDEEGLGYVRLTPEKTDDAEPSGDSKTSPSDHFGKYRDYWGIPIATGTRQTWDDLVREFKRYLADKETKSLGFEDDEGEYRFGDYTHRFMEPYVKRQYAEMKAFEEGAREDYGEDLTTVLLTLTASTTDSDGNPRPPVNHMMDVMDPWDYVRYELRRSLNADRKKDEREPIEDWEYLRILEPTTDDGDVMGGYTHMHVAVVCNGDVEQERFHSVIDKHVEKSPTAGESAHDYDNVIGVHDGNEIENLGAYLFEYLGKSYYGEDSKAYETAFDAMLWKREKRRFQPSEGAQEWMKEDEDEDEDKEWDFLGIVKNEHVEAFEESPYEDFGLFRASLDDDDNRPRSRHNKFRAIRQNDDPTDVVARSGEGDNPPP